MVVSVPVRIARGVMWLLLAILVSIAILVTALRLTMPNLGHFREPITQWLSAQTGVYITVADLEGQWTFDGPDLTIRSLAVTQPGQSTPLLAVDNTSLTLDLWRSLLRLKPVFSDIRLSTLALDLTQIPELDPNYVRLQRQQSGPSLAPQRSPITEQLGELFFVQLDQFMVFDATVTALTAAAAPQQFLLPVLKWVNHNGTHRAEGQLQLHDAPETTLALRAHLTKPLVGYALSGVIYVQANNIDIVHWLPDGVDQHVALERSDVSFETWVNLHRGVIDTAQLQLSPSQFEWVSDDQLQSLRLERGAFHLSPTHDGWQVRSEQVSIKSNSVRWPEMAFKASMSPGQWAINIQEISLDSLRPLHSLLPTAEGLLDELAIGGNVEDIRLGWHAERGLYYSANLSQVSLHQWYLLPEVHHLQLEVRGQATQGQVRLRLEDDVLPYGEVFNAPLAIEQADVMMHWAVDEWGWRLWSDAIAVRTPHLNVNGEFRLDFPSDAPAWLAYYGEADLSDAGHAWRYLPQLALGESLTAYLSRAIQGGKAQTARLLWFGDLQDFPYTNQRGIFQVDVPLKQATYEFYPDWPLLTNVDIDLTFENESFFFTADSAETLDARATQVRGEILSLSSEGEVDVSMRLDADAQTVRKYMAQSPLESSVGVALDYVKPQGQVEGNLRVVVPFDDRPTAVEGDVTFAGNDIHLSTPALTVSDVQGVLQYRDTEITAQQVKGQLFDQPITLSVNGGLDDRDQYQLNVDVEGRWSLKQLGNMAQSPVLSAFDGRAPWQAAIGVSIADNVTYQVEGRVDASSLSAPLPYPLNWQVNKKRDATLTLSGDERGFVTRANLPDIKVQADVDVTGEAAIVSGSFIGIGEHKWRRSPLKHHSVSVIAPHVDLDSWTNWFNHRSDIAKANSTVWPMPTRLNVEVEQLRLATMDWHQLSLALRRHSDKWHAMLSSREVTGELDWPDDAPLSVSLQEAYFNFTALEQEQEQEQEREPEPYQSNPAIPAVTDRERALMAYIPELDISIQSAWLQGYRLGEVSGRLRREGNTLLLQQLEVTSGQTFASLDGHWTLHENSSESQFVVDIDAENSSDVMGRFSTAGGLENAPFTSYAAVEWQGAPWQVHRESMNGEMRTRMGKGVVAQVGGAGRLLGFFSLESILRKLQLDFSGVIDDGLPFNYLVGSGTLENGVFETDDIEMETLAGDLKITGQADLVNEWVDANVRFSPDFTSGLPTLTAFAVAPQSALVVFAISTLLSPVVDVFTQINYQIEGPIDNPTLIERSRSKGEVRVKPLEDK